MKLLLFSIVVLLLTPLTLTAQKQAKVTERTESMITYPFSDPNPIAAPSSPIYPYFKIEGFAERGINQDWKVVILENDFIEVKLFPEVGGKIWGAIDKTTNREFIYYNDVVKFRDIAMRGPWTSGGIEFNFGIIGHVPSTSTPVDYLIKEKEDGSVSCYVSSYELITRTFWMVEVNLEADKAYFTTKTTWHNTSAIDQPYYQWMNAAYNVAGDAQFCYPGTHSVGHGGEITPFPIDEQGRDISWYNNNDFGGSKSYHITGKHNDFFGVYWRDNNYGSLHHSLHDEKLGMKIFLWSLARDGAIWEDLLTDTDGQYIELQSGRMYNQPASNSTYTPYKHKNFSPYETDVWTEYWFPFSGTKGVKKASDIGSLNIIREDGYLKFYFSPLQKLSENLKIYRDKKLIKTLPLNTEVLKVWKDSLKTDEIALGSLEVVIGDNLLVYSEKNEDNVVNRPKVLPKDFDWDSAYGLYSEGEAWLAQKHYDRAEVALLSSLEKDKYLAPALRSIASLYYKTGRYLSAIEYCNRALSLDTYDGVANYIYGLSHMALENNTDAKDGFSVASFSSGVRSASYAKLAELYIRDKNWSKVEHYALKSKEYNTNNLSADLALSISYRKRGMEDKAVEIVNSTLEQVPLYHPIRFEDYLLNKRSSNNFTSLIRNELPHETYMEIAIWYANLNCYDEALTLLSFTNEYPIAQYYKAYLLSKKGEKEASSIALERANELSCEFVFPFRASTLEILKWADNESPTWKTKYYMGLVYQANQNNKKALELYEACGDPNFAPLYFTRAELKEGKAKLADLLNAEKIEKSWRAGFNLIKYYISKGQMDRAVKIGSEYMKLYPKNYYIGLKYAEALCEVGSYKECLSFLSKLIVLPNEGARTGREVYKKANIYQALELLDKKRYKNALKSLVASDVWPENLGVGKPHKEFLDNRLEDYIKSRIYLKTGENTKANDLLKTISTAKLSNKNFSSLDLLSVMAMRELGKEEDADKIVESWENSYMGNKIAEFCAAVYYGDVDNLGVSIENQEDATPWETQYRDANFNLVKRLFVK